MSNRLTESIQIINKNSLGFDDETTHVITNNILSGMSFSVKISQYEIRDMMYKFSKFELENKCKMTYKTFLDKINSQTLNERKLVHMLKSKHIQKMLCAQNPLFEIYLNEFKVLKDFDYTKQFVICTEPLIKSKRVIIISSEVSKLIELNSIELSGGGLCRAVIVVIMFDVVFRNYSIVLNHFTFKKTLINKIRSFMNCKKDRTKIDALVNKYSLPANLLELWLTALENN